MALRIADLGRWGRGSRRQAEAGLVGLALIVRPLRCSAKARLPSCSRMASPWTSTRSHPGCDSRGLGRPIEEGEVRPRLRMLLNGREMI